jgi:hypothetical protein
MLDIGRFNNVNELFGNGTQINKTDSYTLGAGLEFQSPSGISFGIYPKHVRVTNNQSFDVCLATAGLEVDQTDDGLFLEGEDPARNLYVCGDHVGLSIINEQSPQLLLAKGKIQREDVGVSTAGRERQLTAPLNNHRLFMNDLYVSAMAPFGAVIFQRAGLTPTRKGHALWYTGVNPNRRIQFSKRGIEWIAFSYGKSSIPFMRTPVTFSHKT